MYEKRDQAFEDWDNQDISPIFEKAIDEEDWDTLLHIAFNAGWDARKKFEYLVD